MPKRKPEEKHPIALLREEIGLTQAELGKILNVTNRAVSDWESGKQIPSLDNAIALAVLLKISFKTLMGYFDVDVSKVPDDPPNP